MYFEPQYIQNVPGLGLLNLYYLARLHLNLAQYPVLASFAIQF